jgi:hypothetical protein
VPELRPFSLFSPFIVKSTLGYSTFSFWHWIKHHHIRFSVKDMPHFGVDDGNQGVHDSQEVESPKQQALKARVVSTPLSPLRRPYPLENIQCSSVI